jgi:hypothetical protein
VEHMPRIRGLATAAVAGLLTVSMTACGVFDRDQETVTVTQTPASPNSSSNGSAGGASGNGGPAPTPAAPAAAPQAPAPAAPAAPAQTRYTTYYAATSNTSESFAAAVFSAFTATYASTGNSEPTLSVTSPATGQTYTMQCAHYGHTVHCNGGDNAVVGIY